MNTPTQLPTVPVAAAPAVDAAWVVRARRARWLSYLSLVWMLVEGIFGIVAGAEANSIGVIAWAVGSVVEAAAAVIVIVRVTGKNRFSENRGTAGAEMGRGLPLRARAYILFESAQRLLAGSQPQASWLAVDRWCPASC